MKWIVFHMYLTRLSCPLVAVFRRFFFFRYFYHIIILRISSKTNEFTLKLFRKQNRGLCTYFLVSDSICSFIHFYSTNFINNFTNIFKNLSKNSHCYPNDFIFKHVTLNEFNIIESIQL